MTSYYLSSQVHGNRARITYNIMCVERDLISTPTRDPTHGEIAHIRKPVNLHFRIRYYIHCNIIKYTSS